MKYRIVFLLAISFFVSGSQAGWKYSETVDPITDYISKTLSTSEMEGLGSLTVYCRGEGPQLALDLDGGFIPKKSNTISATTRVNKAPPVTRFWNNDFPTKGSVGSGRAETELVWNMKQGDELVIRILDVNGNRTFTRFFDLKGFKRQIAKLPCDPKKQPPGNDVKGEASGSPSGGEVYSASCSACHDTGVVGAPKRGDTDAWSSRIDKGIETLVSHAINGFNVMPAKGGCSSCSDEEIKAAVEFMIEGSQ